MAILYLAFRLRKKSNICPTWVTEEGSGRKFKIAEILSTMNCSKLKLFDLKSINPRNILTYIDKRTKIMKWNWENSDYIFSYNPLPDIIIICLSISSIKLYSLQLSTFSFLISPSEVLTDNDLQDKYYMKKWQECNRHWRQITALTQQEVHISPIGIMPSHL